MKLQKEVLINKIAFDEDAQGLSIPIREFYIIDNQKLYLNQGKIRRNAFRKVNINEEGKDTQNESFEKEVDEWTGEKDFIKNKVNF